MLTKRNIDYIRKHKWKFTREHFAQKYSVSLTEIDDATAGRPVTKEQIASQRARIELLEETVATYVLQIRRLGQCVICGELDEQDGIRHNGEFRCFGCARPVP